MLHFKQASIKASWKCTYGNKFPSNAFSQWRNERYFANNWSLSSHCALKGVQTEDRGSCDIVLASAGSCRTGLPGTQELARINEDARVTPRLLALMARHTRQLQTTQNAIWRHCHGNFCNEAWLQTRKRTCITHVWALAHTHTWHC